MARLNHVCSYMNEPIITVATGDGSGIIYLIQSYLYMTTLLLSIIEKETRRILAWVDFGRILIALCAIVFASVVFVMIATLMKEPAEKPKKSE